MNLSEAQVGRRTRGEQLVLSQIDGMADALCDHLQQQARTNLAGSDAVKNYQLVGPVARSKLKGLINYYRKKAHPFTSCVTDNTKRFGPDRAKKVCAVLTDLEKNTTKWRSGGGHKGIAASESFADDQPVIDEELYGLLFAIGHVDYGVLLAAGVSPAVVKKAWSSYAKPDHLVGGSIHKVNADHIVVHAKGKKHKVPFTTRGTFVRFGSSMPMDSTPTPAAAPAASGGN